MGSEDVFFTSHVSFYYIWYSKTGILKLSKMKKNLPFHDALSHLVFLYFSTARQVALACKIKNNSSEAA